MSGKQVLGGLIALAMVVAGGFVALAGMGYVGDSGSSSRGWSVAGSILAGLGVALGITVFQPRR
jgi:hypothetical protein